MGAPQAQALLAATPDARVAVVDRARAVPLPADVAHRAAVLTDKAVARVAVDRVVAVVAEMVAAVLAANRVDAAVARSAAALLACVNAAAAIAEALLTALAEADVAAVVGEPHRASVADRALVVPARRAVGIAAALTDGHHRAALGAEVAAARALTRSVRRERQAVLDRRRLGALQVCPAHETHLPLRLIFGSEGAVEPEQCTQLKMSRRLAATGLVWWLGLGWWSASQE